MADGATHRAGDFGLDPPFRWWIIVQKRTAKVHFPKVRHEAPFDFTSFVLKVGCDSGADGLKAAVQGLALEKFEVHTGQKHNCQGGGSEDRPADAVKAETP